MAISIRCSNNERVPRKGRARIAEIESYLSHKADIKVTIVNFRISFDMYWCALLPSLFNPCHPCHRPSVLLLDSSHEVVIEIFKSLMQILANNQCAVCSFVCKRV